jgi:Lon protease-like protein
MELPLFPLKTVLLPGNTLPLKIFEARYIDLIANCMRESKPFGVVLIYDGQETDNQVEIFSMGTSARVTDWQNRADGLLGITAQGQQRFRVLSKRTINNGLLIAEVDFLEEETTHQIPDHFYYMSELLRHVSSHKANISDQDFCNIVYQLIYLLPLDSSLKQQLLEVPQCLDRAVVLHAELIRLGVIQYVKPGEN